MRTRSPAVRQIRTHALGALMLAALAGTASAQTVGVQVTALALRGQPAPGLAGVSIDAVGDVRRAEGATLAYVARLAGAGVGASNDSALITVRGGTPSILVREGDAAPGASTTFTGFSTFALASDGRVSFPAALLTLTPNQQTNVGAYVEDAPGTLLLAARDGNNEQRVAGVAQLAPGGQGAWAEVGRLVVREGAGTLATLRYGPTTIVPGAASAGLPADTTFRTFGQPALREPATGGGASRVAFRGYAGAPAPAPSVDWRAGLWTDESGTLRELAIVGAPSPVGAPWREVASAPEMNGAGAVAFWGAWGSGVVEGVAIFAAPAGGAPTPVVRTGDAAPFNAPGAWTFTSLARTVALNDSGRIAFRAFVTDGASRSEGVWTVPASGGTPTLVAARGQGVAGGWVMRTFNEPRLDAEGRVALTVGLANPAGGAFGATGAQALFAADPTGRLREVARVGGTFTWAGNTGAPRVVRHVSFWSDDAASGRSQWGGGELVFRVLFADNSEGLFRARVVCPADTNADGELTFEDIQLFVGFFNAADPRADYNADGEVTFDDVALFVAAYNGGC